MRSETRLFAGAAAAVGLATLTLVLLPYAQLRRQAPPPGLHPYSAAALRGRGEYIREGCVYCHSQQPRDELQAPDFERGWGRVPAPADYYYDTPHLLGTMRTGPDLFNIGARQKSADWQLGHLYQPRAFVPGSIMPAFPYLFEIKPHAAPGDRVVTVPPAAAPAQGVVVATRAALDLADYLLSLDHTYPLAAAGTAGGDPP